MRPLFITFEGLDGSGKSTHLRAVAAHFDAADVPHIVTKEPGGAPLSDAIRSVFLDPRWGDMDGIVELLMVFASRRQHLLEVIEPALASGHHVLCDRFTDSTIAYQGFGSGVALDVIDAVDELATSRRRPDITVLFDLLPEEARSRGQSAKRRAADPAAGGADRLDLQSLEFYDRVRRGFLQLADDEPGRIRTVYSGGPRERTTRELERALADILPAR